MNANALLGFGVKDDDDENERTQKKVVRKFELKDKEGVDFYFYFTQKYQMTHHKNHDPKTFYDKGSERGGRGRGGRGRGRGGRDGAGDRDNYENKEEGKNDQISTKAEEGSLKS